MVGLDLKLFRENNDTGKKYLTFGLWENAQYPFVVNDA